MPTLRIFSLILFLVFYCRNGDGRTVTLEELDAARTWRVKKLASTGNERFSERRLLNEILTQAGPWYAPWRTAPVFDPVTDPALDQADILAVLLFGKPASALGHGEKLGLQRNALAITSGYAAATIGKSVTRALGLERLGLDLEDLDFSGGRVGLSRHITPKTRLSISGDLVGEEGKQISIEYRLSPAWEIETTTRSTGNSGADIIWRKQYEKKF